MSSKLTERYYRIEAHGSYIRRSQLFSVFDVDEIDSLFIPPSDSTLRMVGSTISLCLSKGLKLVSVTTEDDKTVYHLVNENIDLPSKVLLT